MLASCLRDLSACDETVGDLESVVDFEVVGGFESLVHVFAGLCGGLVRDAMIRSTVCVTKYQHGDY